MVEYNERDIVKGRALAQVEEYKNLTGKLQKDKSWITDEQVQEMRDLIQTTTDKIEQIHR